MRVVATRIGNDGTMQRRMVDTARQTGRLLWEDLAARAVAVPVTYRPAPGAAVYHVCVNGHVVMVAEHDLAGPLLDLVTAVLALGAELLLSQPDWQCRERRDSRRPAAAAHRCRLLGRHRGLAPLGHLRDRGSPAARR
jgi:hypothetical protein